MKISALSLLLITAASLHADEPTTHFIPNARVTSPVANCLTGHIMGFLKATEKFSQEQGLKKLHDGLGNSPLKALMGVGSRINHLRYNQPVKILETVGEESLIEDPSQPYGAKDKTVQTCWVHNSHIEQREDVTVHPKYKGTIARQFPVFPNNIPFATHQDIIVLSEPYTEPATGITYAAGTRFVHQKISGTLDTEADLTYRVYDGSKEGSSLSIPHAYAYKEELASTPEEARARFIKAIEGRVANQERFVPYTQGGSAYDHFVTAHDAVETKTVQTVNGPTDVFFRPNTPNGIATGQDPAHFIADALHEAGIAIFTANTPLLAARFQNLANDKPVQNGDILSYIGAAEVIIDNTLTAQRGYMYGYGYASQIPMNRAYAWMSAEDTRTLEKLVADYEQGNELVFIQTADDLQAAHTHGDKLILLNAQGKPVRIVKEFSIKKLC